MHVRHTSFFSLLITVQVVDYPCEDHDFVFVCIIVCGRVCISGMHGRGVWKISLSHIVYG